MLMMILVCQNYAHCCAFWGSELSWPDAKVEYVLEPDIEEFSNDYR